MADIPKALTITLGDICVSAVVHMESSAPFGGDDRGTPFAGGDQREGGDQTDPLGRELARRVPNLQEHFGDSDSRKGANSGQDDTWNSSEIRDRRRPASPPTECRRCLPWAAGGGCKGSFAASGLATLVGPSGSCRSLAVNSAPRGEVSDLHMAVVASGVGVAPAEVVFSNVAQVLGEERPPGNGFFESLLPDKEGGEVLEGD